MNIHDSGDLPLGSNSKNLHVEKVRDDINPNKNNKVRMRKAVQPYDQSHTSFYDQAEKSSQKKKTVLTSTSIDMDDLVLLNEQNIRQYRFRSRRNKVIISVLIVLLVATVTAISIYATVTRLENNCWLYVEGARAEYIVDGKERDRFRTPQSVTGNKSYVLDVDLKIRSGSYNVKFKVEIFQDELLLENTLLDYDQDYFRKGNDGYYYSIEEMSGQFGLFDQVIIDPAYEDTLTIANFRMEVHTYLY